VLSRRSFLAGAAATVGTVVVAACSGGGGLDLVAVPNDWEFLSGSPYRVAVLLADNNGTGAPVAMTAPVMLRIATETGPWGPPIDMAIHTDGPEPNYALTTYRFPSPGNYRLEVRFKGHTAISPIQVIPPSQSATPVVGSKMISVATPTVTDHRGVNPYCTQIPPCPFHEVSLDVALTQKKPVVLQFATPALCQSKFCGPVLLNLQGVSKPWLDRVTFIHAEIYTNLSGQTTTPAVQAYNLQHEPMLYLADATGHVVTRIDNLYDRTEVAAALAAAYGAGASS
jgi:hypothetical protein